MTRPEGQKGPRTVRGLYSAWDRAAFHLVAGRHWPGAEGVLPRLSRSANHGRLWFAVAAGLGATGGTRAKRAAMRGTASLALASLAANTLAKRSVRRTRPLLDAVPLVRRLHRQPVTSSFPSGHSASAAAFATGVALESRGWGLAVAPIAVSVAFSRVYTGVHYPSDVLAGMALGVGAAFAVRGLAPSHSQLPAPARPVAEAPALPEGTGLTMVANSTSGTDGTGVTGVTGMTGMSGMAGGADAEPGVLTALRGALPGARTVLCDPARDDLAAELDAAAREAAAAGGALGVCGGDGTVNAAARAAVRHGVPLAVLPGGTRNHFAADLGIETADDVRRAVTAGQAVAVDLGRFADPSAAAPGADAPGAASAADSGGVFVNTFSLGSYPELVRVRERWADRIGSGPAVLLAAWHVLRRARPVEAGLAGHPRALWLLFAGNCGYRGAGLAPVRRHDLADGLLDVRVVRGGHWARTRLLWSALGGVLGHRHKRNAAMLRRLLITGIPDGSSLAYDGEVAPAPERLLLTKEHEALTVYRPLPD
ncbi:bifunctional phosphatase PAP2/diacylglycerol kinase family protein [Streptomyces sp. NPDC048172]|uniref:bifunctional phosphatase PAP2/diacylglycerol kinase family protein n=1 Tax=Streptomyces sp. NPDC048172 TaxID=3365505 RepID=UPI003717E155